MIYKNGLIRVLEAEADEAFDECVEHTIRGCMGIVERMPSVDAVEVVRCKDCKYWKHFDHVGCSDLAKVCTLANYMVCAVGYCVYGERRVENAAD